MTKRFLDFPDREWGKKKIGSLLYYSTYPLGANTTEAAPFQIRPRATGFLGM